MRWGKDKMVTGCVPADDGLLSSCHCSCAPLFVQGCRLEYPLNCPRRSPSCSVQLRKSPTEDQRSFRERRAVSIRTRKTQIATMSSSLDLPSAYRTEDEP